jgi:formate-dependent nitrite reductase membrane component NrfD
MSSTREERKRRWAAITAKGKTRWIVVRGIFGFGLILTALTFIQAWIVDHSISGLRQICFDLVVRAAFCLIGGYLFGVVTWKWFSHRYGASKE